MVSFFVHITEYCEYKGVRYSTGQKWRDGCDYNCVCVDGMSGVYQCTERLDIFNNLSITYPLFI